MMGTEKYTVKICEDGTLREDGFMNFFCGSDTVTVDVKKTDTAEQVAQKLNAEVESKYFPVPCVFKAVDALEFMGIK